MFPDQSLKLCCRYQKPTIRGSTLRAYGNVDKFWIKVKVTGSDNLISLNHILSNIVRTFLEENYDERLPVQYTWKVPEKGLKINWIIH